MTPPLANSVEVSQLTTAHLSAIAAIHRCAFPDSALSQLGPDAVRRYYAWQMTGPHDSLVLGARLHQQLVGFCVGGRFRGALSGFLRGNWLMLIGLSLTHPRVFFAPEVRQRMFLALRLLLGNRLPSRPGPPAPGPALSKTSFGILAIATQPEWQGQGVGAALMQAAEALARQAGYSAMHLTVAGTNNRAVSFYRGLGWQPTRPGVDQNCVMIKPLIDVVLDQI